MRKISFALGLLPLSMSFLAFADPAAQIRIEHPGDTALSEESPGKFVYKSFPGLAHLYVYDKDSPGKSECNEGCDSAWRPLLVSAGETSTKVGDWSILRRADGRRQWAYKGMPVYLRFHDLPPDDDTEKQGFHLLVP